MEQQITLLTETLQGALSQGAGLKDGFVDLALAGEQLRRALVLAEGDHPEARQALAEYDALLQRQQEPLPDDAESLLEKALTRLEEQARAPGHAKNPEAARGAAMALEAALCLAASRFRMGQLTAPEVTALATRARRAVENLSSRLHDLWELADMRDISFGLDPDLPELYRWWSELAALAPARLEFQASLSELPGDPDPERVRQGVALMSRGLDADQCPSFVDRLRQMLDQVSEWVVPMPAPATAGAYADRTAGPPDVETLYGQEDLVTLLREGEHLVLMAAPSHELEVSRSVLEDGREVQAVQQAPDTADLLLPRDADGATLLLEIKVDGENISLPPVVLIRAKS